jgi:mono/diheme cytochrome c family protein
MVAARFFVQLSLAVCLIGCSAGDRQFTLPTGDPERGQATFTKFRCFDCHLVAGGDLPPGEEPGQVMVQLGGEVAKLRDYGDLITAIVNPSHRLAKGYAPSFVTEEGKSRMTVYNDVMTISELIDIVAFLQAHYTLRPYEPTQYQDYYMP